ncbi:MAG: MBL fold metallo-hydrolase [Pseudomonadota bacterium]
MIIRCYGARGSIPVSGRDYIKYGGDTTCLEIRTKNGDIIIVDAGTGIRRLGNRLLSEERFDYNIIFTHSHLDHISGFPFFKPIYNKKARIHIMGCPNTQGNLQKLISKSMSAPLFPIQFDQLKAQIRYDVECQLSFSIGTMEIVTINLSHPNGGLGYRFVEDGKTFVFLTDNELRYRHRNGRNFEDYVQFAAEADLLIHDAEYTSEQYRHNATWGHSTYLDALELAFEAQVKQLGLFHHNQDRSDAQQDAIVEECRKMIEGKESHMVCFALTQTSEIIL